MSLAILNNNNSNTTATTTKNDNGTKQVEGGDNNASSSSVHINTSTAMGNGSSTIHATTPSTSSIMTTIATHEANGVVDAYRRQIIKRKVLAIGKMSRSYAILREYPDLVQQLKSLSANGKLPLGSLSNGEQGIREAIATLMKNKQPLQDQTVEQPENMLLLTSLKIKEEKEHFTYHHQPTPNYKVVSREGHV
ncbi:hypothetical protein BDF20DRAFT_909437 [Mycotypha africana]|uniref:uncharacterized protein n=1 Tax=Mycotypha africana TaxID=64632 RepID=UPI0023001C0E|nr:uncharacterized protein BDF20DRAFT_909437 [Mycotypha africana]KAI8991694.1 hypothetical protein BDF20DRAFT_909437 [Mycotypha africana]